MTTVVVGGGIAGLVAARSLAARGGDVHLVETADRVGGVIRTVRKEGFLLELGPNTVRPTVELMTLIRELGLESEMLLSDPHAPRYLAWNGRLHALPSSAGSLLSTPLLSAAGKMRLFAEPFVRRRREAGEESVRGFFSRRVGPEIAERFVAPFISGIFAGDPDRLSATAAFPSLVDGEREYGSIVGWAIRGRKSRPKGPGVRGLLSFRDGLDTLPRAIAAHLGGRVETGAAVRAVAPAGDRWTVDTSRGMIAANRIVLACPAGEAARLVSDFAPEASAALQEIPQPPVAVLHFTWPTSALPTPLHGFGHLVVRAPGLRVLGAVWSSSLFAGRAPEGHELITAFAGGTIDPDAARLPDLDLVAQAAGELRSLLRAHTDPRLVSLTRWPQAIPQYEIGHPARIEKLSRAEAKWKGLTFLGAYRGGISVGDVIKGAVAMGESASGA